MNLNGIENWCDITEWTISATLCLL